MNDIKPARGDYAPAMGRRQWLRGFAAAFIAVSGGSSFYLQQLNFGNLGVVEWLAHVGAGFLGNRAAFKKLGVAYLADHPHEANLRRLSRLLCGDGAKSIHLQLIESIAKDWVEHDVTVVDGWVLARTEARICAAFHLMDGTRA